MAISYKTGITADSDIITNGVLKSSASSGDEGGQIDLAKSVTNTTLTTGISIDVFQNRLRFFETGGTNRGFYIDMSTGGTSVGTNLVGGGSAFTGGTLTSNLTLFAGTTASAPLKFQSGTNLTTAAAGNMEFDGTNLYFTPSTARKTVAFTDSAMTGTVNGITLTGTSSTTMTFPSTNATIARTDAAQTFTGVQTFSSNVIYHIATNAQTASYTLALADDGKIVEVSNASANTVTIPLNSAVAFPVGTQITIIQTGAGQTSLAVSAGVTLNCTPQSAANAAKLRAQWSSVTLLKRATDVWVAMGDLTA